MKKTYISPAAQSLEFAPEAMLAASIKLGTTDDPVNVSDAHSNNKIWGGSSIWTNE